MELSEIIQKRVVYSMPNMERAIVRPDIIYKSVDGVDLKMDLYYPSNFAFNTPLPAVIFIHGDGPSEIIKNVKDWGQYVAWGQLVAATGLIGITFNHRSSEDKLSKMVEVAGDVKDLIGFVRNHASEWNIDGNELGIWACSAGVPYLQAVMENPPDYVRCLVAYYGMMDFRQIAGTLPAEIPIQERKTTLAIFRKFSLAYHMADHPRAIPPMFIAQAGLDTPQANATIHQFVERAASEGVKVSFFQHPEGQHGFDVLDNDEQSRLIIQQTLKFLQEHLPIQ